MTTPSLTGAERRTLRGEGQLLEATVTVGWDGISPANTRELDSQLSRNGLIKVRAHEADRKARETLFEQLAEATHSALVGSVGRTALFYRPIETLTESPSQ